MSFRQLQRGAVRFDLGDDDSGCHILHVDMDAFFAAVEVRERPELRGKPVVVGGRARGVVLSATYEARAMGVHSAMPVGQARRACPNAIFVDPSRDKYTEASKAVMGILRDMTPDVEVVSVDEAFLDVRSVQKSVGAPAEIARLIRQRVAAELRLTCSVGVAPVTMAAKLASTQAKPDGLLVVPRARMVEFLHALPVGQLWGVGGKTETQLRALGIVTVGDLAALPIRSLAHTVGKAGAQRLHDLAAGRELRGVHAGAVEKSIGSETTFDLDISDTSEIERHLRALSEGVGRRVRSAHMTGRVVCLKVRYDDFTTITRSTTLTEPTSSSSAIYSAARRMFLALGDLPRAVRLVGVRLEQLAESSKVGEQLSLDAHDSQLAIAESAIDEVSAKFGSSAVVPARMLGSRHLNR